MTLNLRDAGGPNLVRRLVVLAMTVSVAMPVLAYPDGGDSERGSTITVREEHGVYGVSATFRVPYSRQAVLAVLTDYDGISRFMPDIERSIVLERTNDVVIVEQEAVSRLMVFSKRIHLILEITQDVNTLRFHDRSRHSFDRYEGSWRVVEQAGSTHIHYELTAQPSFGVPEFLLKRLLKNNSGQMIEHIQREIARRSHALPE